MSKSVGVYLSQDNHGNLIVPASRFPTVCAVCLEPTTNEYPLEKTFSVGKRVIPIKLYVPMCDVHFEKASFKSPAEKLVGGPLAVIGGLLVGILGAWLAGRPWDPQFQIGLVPSAFMALIFAAIAWAVIIYYAPKFADPASKEARDAVKITRYEPARQMVRLEFRHEEVAQGTDIGRG
jgi:hypothetical protein